MSDRDSRTALHDGVAPLDVDVYRAMADEGLPIEVVEEAAAIIRLVGSGTNRPPSAVDVEDIWYLRTMVATGPRFILQADIDALDAIARRHGGQRWAAHVLELMADQPSVGLSSSTSEK